MMNMPNLPKSSESHVCRICEKREDEHRYLRMIRYELFILAAPIDIFTKMDTY